MKLLTYIHINKNKFPIHSDFHTYNTRGRSRICTLRHGHEYFKKSPYYAGTNLYKLPMAIKNASTAEIFKRKLKDLLLSDVFYNLEEFTNFLNNLN